MKFIDLDSQYKEIKDKLKISLEKVFEHGSYIMGPEVHELEQKLESYVGSNCVTVANGTDALVVSLLALDVGPGDEVLAPSYTWVSTIEVIKLLGATPIFCDIDKDTFNICPDDITKKITNKSKAIIAVSLFGQCADLDKIMDISKEHDIKVIEDCAQSFGATHNGKKACSVADISTTSFFPAKPLGCYGDGGAVFTSNTDLLERISIIPRHGQSGRYNYLEIGLNSRLDTIQAAVLIEKLKIFDQEIQLRQKIAKTYDDLLGSIDGLQVPFIKENNTSVYAQYSILIDDLDREFVAKTLNSKGIPTQMYYPALHKSAPYLDEICLPNTDSVVSKTLSLPMHPYLQESQQQDIVKGLKKALKL